MTGMRSVNWRRRRFTHYTRSAGGESLIAALIRRRLAEVAMHWGWNGTGTKRVASLLLAAMASGVSGLVAAGERFTEPGNALGVEITQELVRRKLCANAADCQELIPIYGGHGNRVNFTAYGVGEKNRDALAVVVEVITRRGIHVTRGVPINFRAYQKPHDEYVNLGFFRAKEPILILDVSK